MKIPWQTYVSEFIGTALLIGVGLSFVIVNFGAGSPIIALLPDAGARRALTGFLFGVTGALIAISYVGKISGAHINPVVTLSFYLKGKLSARDTAGYIVAQFAGAIAGALPLLFWGKMGRSVGFGITLPGNGDTVWSALWGETVTTAVLIIGLFIFLGHKRLRQFTPLLFPFLYTLMVWLEGPLSGTSTNPARSVGPAVVADVYGRIGGFILSGRWRECFWASAFMNSSGSSNSELRSRKIYHFGHDRYGVFGKHRG